MSLEGSDDSAISEGTDWSKVVNELGFVTVGGSTQLTQTINLFLRREKCDIVSKERPMVMLVKRFLTTK